jgi:hypothetical protein
MMKPIPPCDALDRSGSSFLRPKRRTDLRTHIVDGETVVLDRREGLIHQFNKTASFLWELCDGSRTFEQLTQELCEVFEVDFATAQRDVHATVETLRRSRLLEAESLDW